MFGGVGHISLLVSCLGCGAAAGFAASGAAFFFVPPNAACGKSMANRIAAAINAQSSRIHHLRPSLLVIAISICIYVRNPYFDNVSRFLWQVSQNAILLA